MASIGVYICHCGHNIASVVNVDSLRDRIAEDPRVAIARTNVFCCAEPGQKEIQKDVAEYGIDRVLVAACSPRLHETTFRRTIQQAGLNRYLLEMANIREHCSWVHGPEQATEKAYDLLRMALARLELMLPLTDREVPVTRRALVLGAGAAGLKASLELADMQIPVLLVERTEVLGGQAARWGCPSPTDEPFSCFIDPLVSRACLHPLIQLRPATELIDLNGYIGNFNAILRPTADADTDGPGEAPPQPQQEPIGAIVVATGYTPFQPTVPDYPYMAYPGVLTSTALEEAFKRDGDPFAASAAERPVRSVAFLQCVGSRDPAVYPHCSRICCTITLKQALALRRLGIEVTVLHQDIRLYHKDQEETLYLEARRRGVIFQRGPLIEVTPSDDDRLILVSRDEFLDQTVTRLVDRLVLAVGLRPRTDGLKLRQTLRLAESEDGFLLEAHPKLQPLETAMDGIFLAGCCQGPKDIRESTTSALGAAAKTHQILSREQLHLDGMIAAIAPENCAGCGTCEEECPYQAIEMIVDSDGKPKARVLTAACKGCGVCVGACPTGSADLLGFGEQALVSQVREALREAPGTKIIAFCCNWCAYAGADSAGVARLNYPANVRIIRIPCSGRINSRLVLSAFQAGAGRVLVAGCHPPGDCHYISGNLRFQERVPRIRRRLQKRRFNPDHFQVRWISATEGPQFQKTIREIVADMKRSE